MSNDGPAGLIPRKIADRIAFSVFAVFLAFFLIMLLTAQSSHKPSATTTSTTTSVQVVNGPHGLEHRTQTTQRVTNDAIPSVWQSLLGNRQSILLIFAAALLAAYLLAAITQRALLGRYAIGIGPLSVPDLITQQEVSDAVSEALSSAQAAQTTQQKLGTEAPEAESEQTQQAPEPKPEPSDQPSKASPATPVRPAWVSVEDPNLALAGWRIDLERELKRLAEELDFPPGEQRSPRGIVASLAERGVIPRTLANSLTSLLTLANQGVHGARVDDGVITVLRTQGLDLLEILKTIQPPMP